MAEIITETAVMSCHTKALQLSNSFTFKFIYSVWMSEKNSNRFLRIKWSILNVLGCKCPGGEITAPWNPVLTL